MTRYSFVILLILVSGCSNYQNTNKDCTLNREFRLSIEKYLDDCSLQYYKIRGCDNLETISALTERRQEVWDSLKLLYPDSMKYLVLIEGRPVSKKFIIGERALNKIPDSLRTNVVGFEVELEYEVDLGCCNEKICNSFFRFNKDTILTEVVESDFYLTMPRHSKDFIFEQ